MDKKRRTSTDVKRRYNEKTYERIYLQVPKELGERFKEKCNNEGISQAQILKQAIIDYIER